MEMKMLPISSNFDLEPLRRFMRHEVMPGVHQRDHDAVFPRELFEGLHRLGWLQAAIPKEFGGAEASTTDLLWIGREIAYGSCGVFTSYLGNLLGLTAVTLFSGPQLRKKLCTEYLQTFSLFSFCMTEPDAGTDIANIITSATPVPGGYRISGKKCFITNASYSDHLCVFAKVKNRDSERPLVAAFYLPAGSPGITRGRKLEKLGQRDSDTAEIYFDDVFVPAEHRLGGEGDGFTVLKRCIQRSKTLIAGAAVGASLRASDLVSEYLAQRVHYGAPLLNLPTVHSQLAELHTELEASWLLACSAAATWDSGAMAIKEASMAKLFASDMATRFVSESLELFGGYGYSTEFEIERLYRDVRGFEIFEGASLVQQSLIARELFPSVRGVRATDLKKNAA